MNVFRAARQMDRRLKNFKKPLTRGTCAPGSSSGPLGAKSSRVIPSPIGFASRGFFSFYQMAGRVRVETQEFPILYVWIEVLDVFSTTPLPRNYRFMKNKIKYTSSVQSRILMKPAYMGNKKNYLIVSINGKFCKNLKFIQH